MISRPAAGDLDPQIPLENLEPEGDPYPGAQHQTRAERDCILSPLPAGRQENDRHQSADEEGQEDSNNQMLPSAVAPKQAQQEGELHVTETESSSGDESQHEESGEVEHAPKDCPAESVGTTIRYRPSHQQRQSNQRTWIENAIRNSLVVEIGEYQNHRDRHEPEVGGQRPHKANHQHRAREEGAGEGFDD